MDAAGRITVSSVFHFGNETKRGIKWVDYELLIWIIHFFCGSFATQRVLKSQSPVRRFLVFAMKMYVFGCFVCGNMKTYPQIINRTLENFPRNADFRKIAWHVVCTSTSALTFILQNCFCGKNFDECMQWAENICIGRTEYAVAPFRNVRWMTKILPTKKNDSNFGLIIYGVSDLLATLPTALYSFLFRYLPLDSNNNECVNKK